MMTYPLSPDDLRTLADDLDTINRVLFNDDGDCTLPETVGAFALPLKRPDSVGNEAIIGYAVMDDGWVGFGFFDPHASPTFGNTVTR